MMQGVKRIRLDARMEAHLEWVAERGVALRYVAEGFKIEWDMEFGLFSCLHFPLNNEMQYKALKLALEHFCDTLGTEFADHTYGVCLYRGDVDFSHTFHWEESEIKNLQKWVEKGFADPAILQSEVNIRVEDFSQLHPSQFLNNREAQHLLRLFCTQVVSEYLVMLSGSLPENLIPSVAFDTSSCSDLIHRAQLLSKERYPHFRVEEEVSAKMGVCLLPTDCFRPSQYRKLRSAVEELQSHKQSFKFIPESLLTTEWDGLDYLVVDSAAISSLGRRMLQGFCAAGGTVLTVGDGLNLTVEESFSSWMTLLH